MCDQREFPLHICSFDAVVVVVVVVVVVFVVAASRDFSVSIHNGKSVFNSHRVLRIVSLPIRQPFLHQFIYVLANVVPKATISLYIIYFFFIPKWENVNDSRKIFV